MCNDSDGFERYYAAAEELMKEVDARPHFGEHCQSFGQDDLLKAHGAHFTRFRQLAKEHDPDGKFRNEFTRRTFWDEPRPGG